NLSDKGDLLNRMKNADAEFFTDSSNPIFAWDSETLAKIFGEQFQVKMKIQQVEEKRRISPVEIERWFDSENSAYGSHLAKTLTAEEIVWLKNQFMAASEKTVFNWKTEQVYLLICEK
ncbi:MAG: recombinase RarA, partial [Clostridia bacterium]|nr:recombinase RarA [Clostridia bacterium]